MPNEKTRPFDVNDLSVLAQFEEYPEFPGQAFFVDAKLRIFDEQEENGTCWKSIGKATRGLFVPRPQHAPVLDIGDSLSCENEVAAVAYENSETNLPWLHLARVEIDENYRGHAGALDLFIQKIVEMLPTKKLYLTCEAYPTGKEVEWHPTVPEGVSWDKQKLTYRGKEMTTAQACIKIAQRWEQLGLETTKAPDLVGHGSTVVICHGEVSI